MMNFLEGLVLRAAGLPPSAAAAPRNAPAGESLEPEATLEEMIEESPDPPPRSIDIPPERQRVVMRESTPAETPHPPERIVEVRETPAPVLVAARERPEEHAPSAAERFHDEDIETEREVVITPPPSAPLVPSPVRQVVSPHGQALPPMPAHRDEPAPVLAAEPPRSLASPKADESQPRETPQPAPPPVVLQPIVLDRTRTIVEPIREERVVETEHRVVVTPRPPAPLPLATPQREETPEPRADVSPAPPLSEPGKSSHPAPPQDFPRPIADEQSPPQTLVLPSITPISATAPLLSSPHPPAPPVSVRIGTIEIRAAVPPPPPPAPSPVAATPPEPDFQSGFDDYVRMRRYTPEAW